MGMFHCYVSLPEGKTFWTQQTSENSQIQGGEEKDFVIPKMLHSGKLT